MTTDEYLKKVLEAQTFEQGSQELEEVRKHRDEVETLLRSKYGRSPRIRYGGSKAKGTMIRESYDLDIHIYFSHDDTVAGNTLEEIFENVAKTLETQYFVERKRSALRLTSKQQASLKTYLHIDVVPGRFIDDNEDFVFLYQNEGDKQRLQTNLGIQISHVHDSGVTDAIRLIKLWKVRNGLSHVKTFVLELLVVDQLEVHKDAGLEEQLQIVWSAFRDHMDDMSVKDPANPEGNDLSTMLNEARSDLSFAAARTLRTIELSGWESIFGLVDTSSDEDKRRRLEPIAVSITSAAVTKPWWINP